MKGINKSVFLTFFLVLVYSIIRMELQLNGFNKNMTYLINPLVWLFIFAVSIYTFKNEKRRIKVKTKKIQTVLITVMIYLIIYYILGILFGYKYTPYSHNVVAIVKNIWAFVLIIVCQEYIRETLCTKNRVSLFWYIVLTLLFISLDINFYKIGNNFSDYETAFKYVLATLLPLVAKNMLFTYLACIGGYECSIAVRVPIMLCTLIMPLFPDMEWFWTELFDLTLVIIIYLQINYIHQDRIAERRRTRLRKEKLSRQIPTLVVLVLFACFISGVFKYMPVAIMSNSMAYLIERGDVVVIEKLNKEEKKDLKINDIIQYSLDGSSVIHRIVEIKKTSDDEYEYITKGDHNNMEDLLPVSMEQVKGKVLLKVKKIGYPVVLLQEALTQSKPNVEM